MNVEKLEMRAVAVATSLEWQVLRTVQELEAHGGASARLVAWELGLETVTVLDAWRYLIEHGLIIRLDREPLYVRRLYRLADEGAAALASQFAPLGAEGVGQDIPVQ